MMGYIACNLANSALPLSPSWHAYQTFVARNGLTERSRPIASLRDGVAEPR
jgi:hypothetical protein